MTSTIANLYDIHSRFSSCLSIPYKDFVFDMLHDILEFLGNFPNHPCVITFFEGCRTLKLAGLWMNVWGWRSVRGAQSALILTHEPNRLKSASYKAKDRNLLMGRACRLVLRLLYNMTFLGDWRVQNFSLKSVINFEVRAFKCLNLHV